MYSVERFRRNLALKVSIIGSDILAEGTEAVEHKHHPKVKAFFARRHVKFIPLLRVVFGTNP